MTEEEIKEKIDYLIQIGSSNASRIEKLRLAIENLELQTTNNQVETKKALDAIKTGVLDTNLAMKYHNK